MGLRFWNLGHQYRPGEELTPPTLAFQRCTKEREKVLLFPIQITWKDVEGRSHLETIKKQKACCNYEDSFCGLMLPLRILGSCLTLMAAGG